MALATRHGKERVLLQTDLRAHHNPSRMAAIRRLAFLLVRRIQTEPHPEAPAPRPRVSGAEPAALVESA